MIDKSKNSLRQIKKLPILNVVVYPINEEKPKFIWVNPTELYVEEKYQRNLSERSITLIRNIVNNFSWSKFKPPSVAKTDIGYVIIDGQHTAMAAALHDNLNKIPVMVVSGENLKDRAGAFLSLNKNRLNVTATQMYYAALVAEDEEALTIKQVCEKAKVNILKYPPQKGFKVGDTLAIQAISGLVGRRGAFGSRQVLEIRVKAGKAPVISNDIRAIEFLLYDPDYYDKINHDNLITSIMSNLDTIEIDSKVFSSKKKVSKWKATAQIYYEGMKGLDNGPPSKNTSSRNGNSMFTGQSIRT